MTSQPEPPDEVLAARATAGDDRAFTVLVGRHKAALYRFARRYVGDADDAYDVVQQSFVSAWGALDRYDPARSFAPWLRMIALNKCRDHARRAAVRRLLVFKGAAGAVDQVADEQPDAEARWIARQELATLDRAIAALPRTLKEPLLLTAFEGLSQADAGRALGISAKAVETRVYRARRALSETLGKSGRRGGNS